MPSHIQRPKNLWIVSYSNPSTLLHLAADEDGYLARAGLTKTLEASQEDVQDKVTAPSWKMASVGRQKVKKMVPCFMDISDSEASEVDSLKARID